MPQKALIQDNIVRLVRDSKRIKQTIKLNQLNKKQILKLRQPKFNKELPVQTYVYNSAMHVELLHKRLDDVILVLADNQSKNNNCRDDVIAILNDLGKALGANRWISEIT